MTDARTHSHKPTMREYRSGHYSFFTLLNLFGKNSFFCTALQFLPLDRDTECLSLKGTIWNCFLCVRETFETSTGRETDFGLFVDGKRFLIFTVVVSPFSLLFAFFGFLFSVVVLFFPLSHSANLLWENECCNFSSICNMQFSLTKNCPQCNSRP